LLRARARIKVRVRVVVRARVRVRVMRLVSHQWKEPLVKYPRFTPAGAAAFCSDIQASHSRTLVRVRVRVEVRVRVRVRVRPFTLVRVRARARVGLPVAYHVAQLLVRRIPTDVHLEG